MSYLQAILGPLEKDKEGNEIPGSNARGLKFNQLAYITFYEKVDQDNYLGTFHYAAVYGALKANAYVKGQEFTETFESVCDWVDEMSKEDKEKVTEVFGNTAYFKKLVEDGAGNVEVKDGPSKKKKLKNTIQNV